MLPLKKVRVAQSCPVLCNPIDYTVRGILQARILEWVAFPLEKGMATHSSLENSMVRKARQAVVPGVTKSRTRLSD